MRKTLNVWLTNCKNGWLTAPASVPPSRSELEECRPSIERDPYGAHIYKVVLTVSGAGGAGRKVSQPAFKCQNNNVAFKVGQL